MPVSPARLRHKRFALLVTTVIFAGGLMSAWHHQATARHGFCSDHGEQIHLVQGEHEHDHGPADAVSLKAHEHVAGEHDCGVLAFLGQSVLQTSGPISALALLPAPLLVSSVPQGVPAQILLLRLSPKQSPPRV